MSEIMHAFDPLFIGIGVVACGFLFGVGFSLAFSLFGGSRK